MAETGSQGDGMCEPRDETFVISISAGSSHSAALLECDLVTTWGRGEDGQLGHGDSSEVVQPKVVWALLEKNITSVHCGAEYTMAVSQQEQQVYSWGWGDFGRLGHGDSDDVFVPRPIAFFAGLQVQEVACGDTHTLVIAGQGELFSFGRNQNGQLGLGHTSDQLSPQPVVGFQGQQVVSVSGGAEHSIAALASGKVYGWGWGRYGNLGDGHQADRHVPTQAVGLDGVRVVKVNCGWRHSVLVTDGGRLYTYGWSKYGQLGHGDNEDKMVPTVVAALQDQVVVAVAGGWRHTIAAVNQGTLYGWGWNKFGQLGLGDLEDRCTPCPLPSMAGQQVAMLACGWRHTLAVTQAGQMLSWGRGVNGQLGHGLEEDKSEPTQLAALSKGIAQYQKLAVTATPAGGYVSPADRYAVVPGSGVDSSSGFDGGVAVPDMVGPGSAKKAKTSSS